MTKLRRAAGLLGPTALAVLLCGCKFDEGGQAAQTAPPPAPGPLDPAYAAQGNGPYAIPAAYPAPAQAYAYPKHAYALRRTVYEQPPSYAFDYGGEEPWAWSVADQGYVVAEPIGGDWRYYYYAPGEPYPYFVQDPEYGYAYGGGGALIALFDAAGDLLGGDRYTVVEYRARDYWRRGYDLDQAYHASPRRPVDPEIWRAQAPRLAATSQRWLQAVSAKPAWRAAPASAAAFQQLRHDNGRHLGWSRAPGPQVALATQSERPRLAAPPAPAAARPGAQAWREARREGIPHVPKAPASTLARAETHRPAVQETPRREARLDRPIPPQPTRAERPASVPRVAMTAESHGRPASFHGPAPQPRPAAPPQQGAAPRGGGNTGHGEGPRKDHDRDHG